MHMSQSLRYPRIPLNCPLPLLATCHVCNLNGSAECSASSDKVLRLADASVLTAVLAQTCHIGSMQQGQARGRTAKGVKWAQDLVARSRDLQECNNPPGSSAPYQQCTH